MCVSHSSIPDKSYGISTLRIYSHLKVFSRKGDKINNIDSKQSGSKFNRKFMKFRKKVYKKITSTIKDQLTAIRENWNHFDKEFCFSEFLA